MRVLTHDGRVVAVRPFTSVDNLFPDGLPPSGADAVRSLTGVNNPAGIPSSGAACAGGHAAGRLGRYFGKSPGEATLRHRLGVIASGLLVAVLLSGCGQAVRSSSLSRNIGNPTVGARHSAGRDKTQVRPSGSTPHGGIPLGTSGGSSQSNSSDSNILGNYPAPSANSTAPPGFGHLVALKGTEAVSVLSAWHAWLVSSDAAFRTMDWNSPALAATEAPAQLAHDQAWMRRAYEGGYISRGHNYVSYAMVTSIDGGQATVKGCIIGDQVPVSAATGKVMQGFWSGGIDYFTSTMTQIAGNWKNSMDQMTERKAGKCER
ncbi:MAG: hypothetical protein M1399_04860 [Actinobacteria bacterium]|nr:hypothetical protein [Actinomycetota bacterium]MCL5447237.1 hypothetical protein [Actinomycetota bacterium]